MMGATFCTVIKMMHSGQEIPCITLGNHRWKGAAPIFINRADRIIISGVCKWGEKIRATGVALTIIADPRAWIRKYFNAASEVYILVLDVMRGKKDNKFNSKPIQAINHEVEDVAITAPRSRVHVKITLLRERVTIKKRSNFIDGV